MTVWMDHPTLPDALIQVPEQAVDGHMRSGWLVTDPPPLPELANEAGDADQDTEAGLPDLNTPMGPVTDNSLPKSSQFDSFTAAPIFPERRPETPTEADGEE